MKKAIGLALAVLAMSVVAASAQGSNRITAVSAATISCKSTITLPLVTPVTGGAGFLGAEQGSWARYAVKTLAKPLGLKVKFVLGDTPVEQGPAPAQALAQKYIADKSVLVVLGPWAGLGGSTLLGSLLCLGAPVCYGIGFIYTRKHLVGRQESLVSLSTTQVLLAKLQLAVVTPFFSSAPSNLGFDVIASMIALGVLGTGIAYVLNYDVIVRAGATTASLVTYLVPIFSTFFGVVVLSEGLTWNEPVGALVIIAGVAISQGRLRRATVPACPPFTPGFAPFRTTWAAASRRPPPTGRSRSSIRPRSSRSRRYRCRRPLTSTRPWPPRARPSPRGALSRPSRAPAGSSRCASA